MPARGLGLLLSCVLLGISAFAQAQGGGVIEARGEASYRIPIEIPPGPAGHQPELALAYESGTGRGPAGWLGFGWSLAGESRIERETRTAAPFDFDRMQCGAAGVFACYRNDFALDGQDLICASGSCDACSEASPCRFRTQSDDGRLIEYRGAPSGWTIADRDGRVLEYGADASGSGRIANPQAESGEVFSWLLERIRDVHGNEIRYRYDTTASPNVAYLKRIEYGQGAAANRSVEFVLNDPVAAPRPDRPVNGRAGFRQQTDRRVASIEVRGASDALVSRYALAYTQDPDSLRSRLASVQRFGADGVTLLPPHRFAYSERIAGDGFEQTAQPGFFGAPDRCPPRGGIMGDPSGNNFWNIADLNRDGIADLYFVHGWTPSTNAGWTEVALGTGTRFRPGAGLACGFHLARGSLWSLDRLFFAATLSLPTLQIVRSATLDLDGDGYLDHVDLGGSYAANSPYPVPRGIRLGGANGFSAETLPTSFELPHDWDFRFGNFWTADEFWIRIATAESGVFESHAALADLTGDGRPDLIGTRGTTPFEYYDESGASPAWAAWSGWAVFANRGLAPGPGPGGHIDFGDEPALWPAPPGDKIDSTNFGITRTALVDLNGDGLPDQLTLNGVAYGYGAGFLPFESVAHGLPKDLVVAPQYVHAGLYDLNGDGFLDHVSPQNGPADLYWHVRFGDGRGFSPTDSVFRRVVDWLDEAALESDGTTVTSRAIRDVNGDGRLDYVAAALGSVFLQAGVANHDGERSEPIAGLLTRAVDPLGGTVEFSYATSAAFQTGDGMPANPGLAQQRPVVVRVTYGDGRTGTPEIVSTYSYANGVFDFAEKEFRGFGTVVETEVGEAADSARRASTFRTDRVCAFALAAREVSNAGIVLARESTSFLEVVGGGAELASQWTRCLASVRLDEAVEGDEAARRVRRTAWVYGDPIDANYNVARLEEWGEWDPVTDQDLPGDERFTSWTWLPASAAWPSIVSRVGLEVVADAAGNAVEKRATCYAGANGCGEAGNGRPANVVAYLTDYFADPPIIEAPVTTASIEYDAFGNVAQHTGAATPDDPDGLRTSIEYDPTYRTFPREIRVGADVAAPLVPIATSIEYGECAGGTSAAAALGLPCRITAPGGQIELFEYDVFGRAIRLERPSHGRLETHAYALPAPGEPAETRIETRVARAGEPDLVERRYLDGLARVYREESPGTAAETVIVTRSFDERGRLRSESLPHVADAAPVTEHRYDALGRPRLALDPDGSTLRVLRYAPWTRIEETYFGSESPSDRAERSERVADGLGRIVRTVNHEDAVGLTRPLAVTARFDAADRLLELRDPVANDPTLCATAEMDARCATQDHVTGLYWDTLGRRVGIDDPDSGSWRFRWDDAGRLVSRSQNPGTADARTELYGYDALGRIRARSFSPQGNGIEDASFVYGTDESSPSFARLVGVESASEAGTSYAYAYDAAGRRAAVVQRTSGLEFDSAVEYDALDRVRRRVFPDGDAFDYAWDGLRLREIRADAANSAFTGAVLRHAEYDALGRMRSVEIGERAGGAPLAVQSFDYDASSGRLVRVGGVAGGGGSDDPDGDRVAGSADLCPYAWDPDQLDRGGLGEGSAPDSIGDACQCGDVDGSGSVTLSDAFAILMSGFSDDALARPELCDVDGNGACDPYDFVGVVTALWSGGGDLQRCAATLPSNLPTSGPIDLELAFDGLGRLVSQSGTLGGETVARSFGYDGLSRLVSATGPWEKARGFADPVTWTYRYDALGNLRRQESSRAEASGGDHRTWRYLHASKPRALTEFVQSGAPWEAIAVALGGEPAQVDRGANHERDLLRWNAQGRLHRYRGSTWAYDVFGGLTQTQTGAIGAATSIVTVGDDFDYDVGAQRANKYFSVGGVRIASLATSYAAQSASLPPALQFAQRFAGLAGPPIATALLAMGTLGLASLGLRRRTPDWVARSGVALLAFALVFAPYALVAATLGSGPGRYGRHAEPILAHLIDHLGSVRASVNQDGIVVETRDYAPFGEAIAHGGAFAPQHRFTGQPQDDRAGDLYNYGARFYDPRWGRFISPDEYVQSVDSQGLNPFSYVLNRPTSLVDPTGRFAGVAAPYGNVIAFLGGHTRVPLPGGTDPSSPNYDKNGSVDVWNTPVFEAIAEMRLLDSAGSLLGGIGEGLRDDLASALIGLLWGNLLGALAGFGETLVGVAQSNGGAVRGGVSATGMALIPRYGLMAGPGYGSDFDGLSPLTVIDIAAGIHDEAYSDFSEMGVPLLSPLRNGADLALIKGVWQSHKLGPVGQAYRVALSAAFAVKIAVQTAVGGVRGR